MENAGMSYLRCAPNYRVPFGHRHNVQEEIYVLVNGSARLKLDDEIVELKQWDAVRIPKETVRNLEGGPEGAEIIAFGAPKTGPGDGPPMPGWWTD
jgi:mannose-6-phosphate isomerase-like protein (cupin superfamily)